MAKVITMGEIMLRLSTPNNEKFIQADEFDVNYGGGEANVAVSLANYGHDAEFVTAVPDNEIGECAVALLLPFWYIPFSHLINFVLNIFTVLIPSKNRIRRLRVLVTDSNRPSVLRCRTLASYVPLREGRSGSGSVTEICSRRSRPVFGILFLFLYQMNCKSADLFLQVDSLQVALGISLSGLFVELNTQNSAQVVDSSLRKRLLRLQTVSHSSSVCPLRLATAPYSQALLWKL